MREDKVMRTCKIRMSEKQMADLLYAVIMTHAKVVGTFGVGIYEYSRKINARHKVDICILILPQNILTFEELSGVKLEEFGELKTN